MRLRKLHKSALVQQKRRGLWGQVGYATQVWSLVIMVKQRQVKAVDPFCPATRREQLQQRNDKKKVNTKPKNLDDQEIPYKLRELMKSRKEMNEPKKKRKRRAENKYNQVPKPEVSSVMHDIPVPKFKRQKKESVYKYIQRMDSATKHVMFLTKSQPDRVPEKEDISVKGSQLQKPKKKEFDIRRQERKLKKKTDKKVDQLEKEMFQDRVEFGEVAMQPPSFTAKPRKGVNNVKPGERQLLLKRLFNHENATSPRTKLPLASLARQRIMEEERERVVKAYRALKKQKQLEQLSQNKQKATGKLKKPK